MATEPTPSSGLAPPIDLVHKVSSCPTSGESQFVLTKQNGKLSQFFLAEPNLPTFCFRTNVLDRYFNKDFTLTLPDGKKITDIKWFAVYDLGSQVSRHELHSLNYLCI